MYLPLETTGAIFVGGVFKWIGDRIAARKKLSAAGAETVEQRGTLLASGFIAGEAIVAILLSVAFIGFQALRESKGAAEKFPGLAAWAAERFPALSRGGYDISFTRLFAGLGELPFFADWGGWLSLIVFGVVGYILVRLPFSKGLPR